MRLNTTPTHSTSCEISSVMLQSSAVTKLGDVYIDCCGAFV